MKSPFPGMDPYLERHWRDVHASLIIYSRDRLQEQLPAGLRCRVEERVVLENPEGISRGMYPDLRVMESKPRAAGGAAATALLEEPIILHIPDEIMTETFLEIIDVATGQKVITVVEFLSVTNKLPGPAQEQYLRKRNELRQAGVSLVEIDLLRGGQRFYPVPPTRMPASHLTTYQVCAYRGWQPEQVEVYRVSLREPLPTVRIPLRPTDADARLELQPLIEKCYVNGRYQDIDYRLPLEPPLTGKDGDWTREILQEAGKGSGGEIREG